MHERLDRTTHVVQQLLTLARQEPPDSTGIQHVPVDLAVIAETCVAELSPLAETKHIRLNLHIHIRHAQVHVSAESLRILLDNLIDNAIRYTPDKGEIEVMIDRQKNQVTLIVTDSGPGIPPEDRERVFDRFFRREDSGETGSGLGLAIVKTIVDRNNAELLLDESRQGGTEVRVRFAAEDTG